MNVDLGSNLNQKIYVAGHSGMVGSAIVRALKSAGYLNIISKTHADLDLTNQTAVRDFFESELPDQVYLAAAKVGGIHANNTFPAEFIYENMMVQNNVIHQSFKSGVKQLLFLGSSCIYPRLSPQPMSEDALMTGKLEATNEPYAIAKIAGIKMCESYNRQYGATHGVDYRSLMPTNLYGPGDNYHPENSHVIPALIRRFHEAKLGNVPEVVIWGTGTPRREFLFVDDMADACLFIMGLKKIKWDTVTSPMESHLNIGFGEDIEIRELAELLAEITKYKGKITYDFDRPNGTPKKLLSSKKIRDLGFIPKTTLKDGLAQTYRYYLEAL
jgi:GDP-L-fucose synthase